MIINNVESVGAGNSFIYDTTNPSSWLTSPANNAKINTGVITGDATDPLPGAGLSASESN